MSQHAVTSLQVGGDEGSELDLLRKRVQELEREAADNVRLAQRLSARDAVTGILSNAATMTEALEAILMTICESLQWSFGGCWVPQHGDVLRCLATHHLPAFPASNFDRASREFALGPGVGLPGLIWRSREAIWIEDVQTISNFPRKSYAAADGLRSAFGFPVRLGSRPLAVMEFFSNEIRNPDEDLLAMFSAIGDQIGQFIERKNAEFHLAQRATELDVLFSMADAVNRSAQPEEVYEEAMTALQRALGADRATVLLNDAAGVMRFRGWRGLSDTYRAAVDGHSPWTPHTTAAEPIVISDVETDPTAALYLNIFRAEGIRALGFIPLFGQGRLLGKFMIYYNSPHRFTEQEIRLASTIAGYMGIVTERRLKEAEIVRREELLRSALTAAQMGTWYWDSASNAVKWSDTLEALYGLAPGTFGGTYQDFLNLVHPDDLTAVLDNIARAGQNGPEYEVEFRIVRPDGSVRWIADKGRVQFDDAGRPIGITGVCWDSTRRRENEEAIKRVNEDLQHFSYAASHDLQEPLRTISAYSIMLSRRYKGRLDPDADQFLNFIGLAVKRMEDLISGLLSYSGAVVVPEAREEVDLREVAAAAIANLEQTIKESEAVITWNDLPSLRVEKTRMIQVFQNLMANSIRYRSEKKPEICITSSERPHEWVFRFADNGVGIDPQYFETVFGMFRRLHGRDIPGSGLGLSICKRVVERHGGRIWVESEPGNGSCFCFTISKTGSATL
jgi:PAS domain S-box-containing protein